MRTRKPCPICSEPLEEKTFEIPPYLKPIVDRAIGLLPDEEVRRCLRSIMERGVVWICPKHHGAWLEV